MKKLKNKRVLQVTYFRNVFLRSSISSKKTNENKSTRGIIVVKSNLFVRFLEEIDDPKNHFEIN